MTTKAARNRVSGPGMGKRRPLLARKRVGQPGQERRAAHADCWDSRLLTGHEAPAESASCTMIGQRHVENPSPECYRATTMRRCPASPFAFKRTCACTPPQAIFYQYFVPGPKALVRGRDVIHSPPSFAVPRNKRPQANRAPCTIRTSLHLANNPLPCNQSII
jgi:hypothetical protein